MNRLSIVQRSVLVIDDEPAIGEVIGLIAQDLGMTCKVLTSALQMEKDLDPGVTAIVLDLMMPGMDGIEVVRLLAERQCRATIVLMSGHDRGVLRSVQEMARTLGLRTGEPLQKPFKLADIRAMLNAVAEPQLDRRKVVRAAVVPLVPSGTPRRSSPTWDVRLWRSDPTRHRVEPENPRPRRTDEDRRTQGHQGGSGGRVRHQWGRPGRSRARLPVRCGLRAGDGGAASGGGGAPSL